MMDDQARVTGAMELVTDAVEPLQPGVLRWRCDPGSFAFQSTAEIEPIRGVVGQDVAVEALRFGLECMAQGQNIFVRGLSGTGRMTLIRRLLTEIDPACKPSQDRVYVFNFEEPGRPKLLTLPRGTGHDFARSIDRLISFIREDMVQALTSESMRHRLKALQRSMEEQARKLAEPLERSLAEKGMALVTMSAGQSVRPAILPVADGKPVSIEDLRMELVQGNITQEQFDQTMEHIREHQPEVDTLTTQIDKLIDEHRQARQQLIEEESRSLLQPTIRRISRAYNTEAVREFLQEIIDDLLNIGIEQLHDDPTFTERYRANPVLVHEEEEGDCPAIIENSPSVSNLIGGIDRQVGPEGRISADHMSIRSGSLLEADGGYLILEARDVLAEPGAWKALIRTLRTRKLEISPGDIPLLANLIQVKPEPIDVNVKVILIGDPYVFYLLDEVDQDFPQLFKVLAEFDTVVPRDEQSLQHYAGVVKRIVHEDTLVDFSNDGVAALVEHGARIASSRNKLTARFNRIADIAREAAFLAKKDDRTVATGDDVRETVRRTKRRADLSSRKFQQLLADGTIRVATQGIAVGQINGLAVMSAGPLTYGFPARITASIGPGSAGVVNIERESLLSGAIHTKGFLILNGLLRYLLQTDHPLTFDASIAFEQSYGGIDGDSASGAEICCLLSALTQVPVRQDLAMTGAIDQKGNVLAIGGVNEKIEGFFDTCCNTGLTGTQGVIIPQSNAGDLMLRHDVVTAAERGEFHVYAVESILQAIELLMQKPVGTPHDGVAGDETVLGTARMRARQFWRMSVARMTVAQQTGERGITHGAAVTDSD